MEVLTREKKGEKKKGLIINVLSTGRCSEPSAGASFGVAETAWTSES